MRRSASTEIKLIVYSLQGYLMGLCRGDWNRCHDPITHTAKWKKGIDQGALLTQRIPTLSLLKVALALPRKATAQPLG